MDKYSIQSAQPQTGFIVTGPDGTPHIFAKLWLALAYIEKQLK